MELEALKKALSLNLLIDISKKEQLKTKILKFVQLKCGIFFQKNMALIMRFDATTKKVNGLITPP